MGIGFSSSHLLEPELFRDIPDTVEREKLFELYADWTVDDCQVAAKRFAAVHEERRRELIDKLETKFTEKKAQVEARRTAEGSTGEKRSFFGLGKISKKKGKAPLKEKGSKTKRKQDGGDPGDEGIIAYDPLLERLEAELTELQRKLDNAKKRSVPNAAIMHKVGWRHFYDVLSETEELRQRTLRERARKTYHPATAGYTMSPDPDAQDLLNTYNLGQLERPGLQDHEIDGHTDDSASETDTDTEEESGTEEEEEEDEDEESDESDEYDDGSDEDDSGSGSAAESQSGSKQGSDEDGGEKIDDEARIAAALADYESGDEEENELRRPKMVGRPLPDIFNPALCSPVFFGYTTETVAHEEEEYAAKQEQERKAEAQVEARQHRAIKDMILRGEAEDKAKRDAYVRRGAALRKAQEHAKNKREAARRKSEKMLAPDDPFFAKWDADEKIEQRKAKEALRAYEAQKDSLEALLHERAERRKKDAIGMEAAESSDRPRGPQLMMQAQRDLHRVVQKLNTAREELEDAEHKLRLTTQESKGKEKEMRSVMLKAEDDVARSEKECTAQLDELETCEGLLQRALKIQEREARYLPLWDHLVSPVSYTVLLGELLFALSIGAGKAQLGERMRFNFEWFDVDRSHELNRAQMLAFVKISIGVLEKIGDVRRHWLLSQDEAKSICHRAFRFGEVDEEQGGALPFFEFSMWLKHVISKCRNLARLFDVPWHFEQMSRLQRQKMGCCHQFEIGLINMVDLKYRVARELVTYRPELAPERKEEVHELALAMGQDDPLKPDYTKFLPKKRRKGWSNVIPLEHGHLHNLTVWRRQYIYDCATMIQSAFRAFEGRIKADNVAKKNAFYHAKLLMLLEVREKVSESWHRKDAQKGVAKMKWDAKIRMKQVSLRANGLDLNRDETFEYMLKEATRDAQNNEVEEKFKIMAEERGFKGLDNVSGVILRQIAEARYEEWSPKTKRLEAQKKQGLDADGDKMAPVEAGADQHATAQTDVGPEIEDDSSSSSGSNSRDTTVVTASSGATSSSGGDARSDATQGTLIVEEKKVRQLPLGHTAALSKLRKERMVVGEFPLELYKTGETEDEAALRETLAIPNPDVEVLTARLMRLSSTFSPLKTFELLLELPSKRLLCDFVQKYPNKDDLMDEAYGHFRITRDTEHVVDVLINWAKSDLEYGYMQDMALKLIDIQEASLRKIAAARHERDAAAAEEVALKRARAAAIRMADLSEEALAEEIEQKRDAELSRRSKAVEDARKNLVKYTALLGKAERTLEECERKQVRREDPVRCTVKERKDWMARLIEAQKLAEDDEGQMALKMLELHNVMGDFLACASRNACQIVAELGLGIKDKSIKPVKIDDTDRRTKRSKYIHDNIYFKLCTDDHGIFNGHDENSAKSFGCEIRGSLEYMKCGIEGLHVPLQCVVDTFGFRVFCCAYMPLQRLVFNAKGEIKKTIEDHVYGTADRGVRIKCANRALEQKLAQCARKLNLARHGVKGDEDLTMRFLPSAGDMKGYKVQGDAHSFWMLNFRRALPMEDPEATPHLPRVERGQSIFCRQLRPEFVRDYKVPLSADANCKISKDGPDWEEHVNNAREATQQVVREILPQMAEDIARLPLVAEGELPSIETLDLTQEMHRRGVGMRHLGLLRTKFWTKLTGPAELQYGRPYFLSAEGGTDFTEEVGRGWQVRVGENRQLCRVAQKGPYDKRQITLDRSYKGASTREGTVMTGAVSDMANSGAVRLKIAAEMIARTTKQLIRFYMRVIVRKSGVAFLQTLRFLIIEFLNMLTGAHAEAENFWANQLFLGVRQRFGRRALSVTERPNLRLRMEPTMPYILRRLSEMMGFELTNECKARFDRSHPDWATARLFLFTQSDFAVQSSFMRTKHNMSHLEFYKGQQALMQAKMTQATTYSRCVLMDQPIGYWRLTERIGSKVAKNLGIGGVGLSGFYRDVVMEAPGPVYNDDVNRATRFSENAEHPSVDVRYHPNLAPQNPEQSFSVECWARATGMEGTVRTCVMSGRFALAATKRNFWAFIVYGEGAEIMVKGADVVMNRWTHLLGTYDGTVMRFYIDGVLVGGFEVGPALSKRLADEQAASQTRWSTLENAEKKARTAGRTNAKDAAERYFHTNEGAADLKDRARKLQEQADFRLKTNKKAKEQGIKRLGRKEATAQAKAAYTQKLLDESLKALAEEFQTKRNELKEAEDKSAEDRRLLATRDLKIGGACASKRAKHGRKHFAGDLSHVATYLSCLSHDAVNRHYLAGTQERALQSDRQYALAYKHFSKAMWWAPEDPAVLHAFGDTICGALRYDNDHIHHFDAYKIKVADGIAMFKRLANCRGLCEIMRCMPAEEQYGGLCCLAFNTIIELEPDFFGHRSYMPLAELGRMYQKFSLISTGAEPFKVKAAADMAKLVLEYIPEYYGDGMSNLRWLCKLETPGLVAYFIVAAETDADIRHLDFGNPWSSEMTDQEMRLVTNNCRDALSFILTGCHKLTDFGFTGDQGLAHRCKYIEKLNIDGCKLLSDDSIDAVAKECKDLRSINVANNDHISDISLAPFMESCVYLREVTLSRCRCVTDETIIAIAQFTHYLELLHVDYCMQLTNMALIILAKGLCAPTLTSLDLSACRRISDHGITTLIPKTTRLRNLSLYYCGKVTSHGIKAVTHNCLELETLNLGDLYQITDVPFFFDREGDGRHSAETHMMHKIRDLCLSDCKEITDHGLSEISRRCSSLEKLSLTGCIKLTDAGVTALTCDVNTGAVRGQFLKELDLTFCTKLTDTGLQNIMQRCKRNLQTLKLNGCVEVSDECIQLLSRECGGIQNLSLAHLRMLTDAGLKACAENLWLEELDVSHCQGVTDKGLLHTIKESPGLTKINISWCRKITDVCIEAMLKLSLLRHADVSCCDALSPEVLDKLERIHTNMVVVRKAPPQKGKQKAGHNRADNNNNNNNNIG